MRWGELLPPHRRHWRRSPWRGFPAAPRNAGSRKLSDCGPVARAIGAAQSQPIATVRGYGRLTESDQYSTDERTIGAALRLPRFGRSAGHAPPRRTDTVRGVAVTAVWPDGDADRQRQTPPAAIVPTSGGGDAGPHRGSCHQCVVGNDTQTQGEGCPEGGPAASWGTGRHGGHQPRNSHAPAPRSRPGPDPRVCLCSVLSQE